MENDPTANRWYKYEMLTPDYHQIRITENKWKGVGWQVWPSAYFASKFLERSEDDGSLELRGKNVIELGAGCGLISLVAAHLGANVVATDTAEVMPILSSNLDSSRWARRGSNTSENAVNPSAPVQPQLVKLDIEARQLDWGTDIRNSYTRGLQQVILGSDVLYFEEAHHSLFMTLLQLFGPDTVAYITHVWRKRDIEKKFLQTISQFFDVRQVATEDDIKEYAKKQKGKKEAMGILRRGSSIDIDALTAADQEGAGEAEPLVVLEVRLKKEWAANIKGLEAETDRLMREQVAAATASGAPTLTFDQRVRRASKDIEPVLLEPSVGARRPSLTAASLGPAVINERNDRQERSNKEIEKMALAQSQSQAPKH